MIVCGPGSILQDLMQALRRFHTYTERSTLPLTFEFISVKSYHGTQSTGTVKISGADTGALHGKHVLLCEDIIDSGEWWMAAESPAVSMLDGRASSCYWLFRAP